MESLPTSIHFMAWESSLKDLLALVLSMEEHTC